MDTSTRIAGLRKLQDDLSELIGSPDPENRESCAGNEKIIESMRCAGEAIVVIQIPMTIDLPQHTAQVDLITLEISTLTITDQASLEYAIAVRDAMVTVPLTALNQIYEPILTRARDMKKQSTVNLKSTSNELATLSQPFLDAKQFIDGKIKQYDLDFTATQRKVYDETVDKIHEMASERILDKAGELLDQGKSIEGCNLLATIDNFKSPLPEFKPQRLDIPSTLIIAHTRGFTVNDYSKVREPYLKPREENSVAIRKVITQYGKLAEGIVGGITVHEHQPQIREQCKE